jgi:hypothetical protein
MMAEDPDRRTAGRELTVIILTVTVAAVSLTLTVVSHIMMT